MKQTIRVFAALFALLTLLCLCSCELPMPKEGEALEDVAEDVMEEILEGDPDAVRRFFVQKTEQIPSSWVTAYEKAKQHNDAVKMRLEQIKLDTIGEIKENFAKIWEGAE